MSKTHQSDPLELNNEKKDELKNIFYKFIKCMNKKVMLLSYLNKCVLIILHKLVLFISGVSGESALLFKVLGIFWLDLFLGPFLKGSLIE